MSKTPERLAYEAWYRKQFDSTMYCESTWRGWEAGRAALTQAADAGAAEPVAWPRDAAEVRQFMKGNCASLEWAVDEATPHQDDRYQLTAHDFLSAVNWWADFPHLQAAQQLQQAVARARKEEQEIMHGLLRPVVVEAIRGIRGAPDIEENGKSLVTEIEDVFRAAIRQQGTP